MIIYNHVYDIYNCAFRVIALLFKSKQEFSIEQIRIFDFIVAFPEMLNTTTIPKGVSRLKKLHINKYLSPQSYGKVFYQTENFQISALKHLMVLGIIDENKFKNGIIILNDSIELPEYMIGEVNSLDENTEKAINICINGLYSVPVNGDGGLKQRTKIMEYRYDK